MKTNVKKSSWNKGLKRAMTSSKKGKTYEEFYGIKRANQIKEKSRNSHLGNIPSNKGVPSSEEKKRKMSIANKGKIISEETRRKISKALKGRIGTRLGSKTSEKTKALLRKALLGRKISKETRKKISIANKGRVSPRKGKITPLSTKIKLRKALLGHKVTKETRLKISIANKGHKSKKLGKSFEEEYGYKRAKQIIKKLRISRANQIHPVKDTTIEIKIQNFLKQLGIEFATHQYMKIKYSYQCDIFIPEQDRIPQKIVIECDGDYWHGNLEVYPIDKMATHIKVKRCLDYERTAQLEEAGFKVIRLWENKIRKMELNKFEDVIIPTCKTKA